MTLFDDVVLFVLIASVVIGAVRGLVKEILSLLSWVVAFVLANAYSAGLAQMLPGAIPGAAVRMMVAFIALFFAVRLLMGLLSMAVGALITASGLSLMDRAMGSLFGLARGIVFVLFGVILCGMTSIAQQDFWKHALLSPIAETGVRTVKPLLPAAFAQYVHF